MTLRTFLIKATTANLLFAWIPVICCAIVAAIQHSERAWDVYPFFPALWSRVLMVLALATFVLSSVSFYRRDFVVGTFALVGSGLVFLSFWVAMRFVNTY